MTERPTSRRLDQATMGFGGVLIVGLAHSGKTEVRRILDTSERVHSTRRVRHWARMADAANGPPDPSTLDEWARAVKDDETLSSWDVDMSQLLRMWHSLEKPTVSGLLALLHAQDAAGRGADIWCAQVNRMEPFVEQTLEELPGIKLIHTVRDPRTGLGVSRRSGFAGRRGWDLAAWEFSAQVAIAARDRHPGRYQIVRWEDLVASPHTVCRSLGEFVAAEFHIPDTWRLTDKPIGRGVASPRIHREISPVLDALGYDKGGRRPGSTVADVVDLISYRANSRRLRRRPRGTSQ